MARAEWVRNETGKLACSHKTKLTSSVTVCHAKDNQKSKDPKSWCREENWVDAEDKERKEDNTQH